MTDLDAEEREFPPTKILAVDDNAADLLALEALLEPLENRLVQARSGPEALDLASQSEFALILLDVMMPVMDGFETLARLRAIPTARHVPVILLTAFELDPRAIERAHKMGAVDYVLKPILPELLRGKVAALVSLHRRGEEIRRRGAALAAKDRDIAMLAHDLQNPLTAIMTSAEWLQRVELDLRARKAVDRIFRSSARMIEMIRSLTDYARVGRGAIPISPTAMDLGDLCRELVDDSQVVSPACSIELRLAGELRVYGIAIVSIRRSRTCSATPSSTVRGLSRSRPQALRLGWRSSCAMAARLSRRTSCRSSSSPLNGVSRRSRDSGSAFLSCGRSPKLIGATSLSRRPQRTERSSC
jgi:CheY-like chemotaxis protein